MNNQTKLLFLIAFILWLCSGCQAIKTFRGNWHIKKAEKHLSKAESINPALVKRDTVRIIKIKTIPATVIGDTASIERFLNALRDTVLLLEGDRFKTLVSIDYPDYQSAFWDSLRYLPPVILEGILDKFKDVISSDIRYVIETQVPDVEVPVDVPVEETEINTTGFETVPVEKTPAKVWWFIAFLIFVIVVGIVIALLYFLKKRKG